MKILFDTSVLVAALINSHPRHESAIHWLQQVKLGEIEMVIATHTLAELYAMKNKKDNSNSFYCLILSTFHLT